MTSEAHKVYRLIKFEIVVTDDDDCIQQSVENEKEKLKKISLKDLIKSKVYDVVEDEVDSEFIDSWEDDEDEEKDE